MNFDFSDDEKTIRDQISRYLQENCSTQVNRRVLDGDEPFAGAVWQGLVDMGVTGTAISDVYGGVDAGYLTLCLAARELGASLAPVPFSSSIYLAAEAISLFGSEAQKASWLSRLASGEAIGTLAVAESSSDATAESITCGFANGQLNGRKLIVPHGLIASLGVVVARGEDGVSMYIAELDGTHRSGVATVDPTMASATIEFSGTSAELLGVAGAGWSQLEKIYDRAAVLYAFEQIGGAQKALDMAVAYAQERFAFGRPIGSFQALKHMMADMYVALKLAESNGYYAAWALANDSDDLPLTAATARVSATQAFQLCARDNIQIHGGMGFTWEFDCHLYYRRSNYLTLVIAGLSTWEDKLVAALPANTDSTLAQKPKRHNEAEYKTSMDFSDTAEELQFRQEVREWIQANVPLYLSEALAGAGFGSTLNGQYDALAEAKRWQKTKAEAGWACLQWPAAYGGRNATPIQSVIWTQEEGVYSRLNSSFLIGQGMCGPTMMSYASEEQKKRFLPTLASGEEVWCQLFSEPHAGSDLAGLRTRAVKDGNEWVINGQKIWTSGAQYSDFGILITRTDPEVPKHRGLTMFFLDMRSTGVDIRPIKQANGDSGFNEVYFDNVRIPDEQRLGEVGDGWRVSLTTLMNERLAIGGGMATGFPELKELVDELMIASGPAIENQAVRSKLADWYTRSAGLKNTSARAISALSKGEMPGPENSLGKLVAGGLMQDIAKFALDLQGLGGAIIDPEIAAGSAQLQAMLMRSPAVRIEGGQTKYSAILLVNEY